jgi:glycosyltransferase involved in cell wall biosynthesis
MKFKVSVIITAYNAESYISRSVYSVINQTLKNVELIIIDDGSTDQTLDVLYEIKNSSTHSSINIITRENKGVAASRAEGLKLVNGEFYIFLDSDDWFEFFALERFYNEAINSSSDIVISNYYLYKPGSTVFVNEMGKGNKVDIVNQILIGDIKGFSWNKMVRTKFARDNIITFVENVNYLEDLLYSIKIILASKKVVFIKEALIYYSKENESSITGYLNYKKIIDIIKVIDLIGEHLSLEEEPEKFSLGLCNLKMHHKYNIMNSNLNDEFFMLFENCKSHVFKTNLSLRKKIILYLCFYNKYLVVLYFKVLKFIKCNLNF